MGVLRRIWLAMKTQDIDDAGTDDTIVLTINDDGVDKLNYNLPKDPDTGRANVYEINVEGLDIRSERLTNSSFRLGIRGDDLWHPRNVLIWGEIDSGEVVSLAAEWFIEAGISTDSSEGNLSFPLRRIGFPTINPVVGIPDTKARINQLLVIMTTADVDDADTDDSVELQIFGPGGGAEWIQPFGTPGEGQSAFSFLRTIHFPPPFEARRNNLESATLRIKGDDMWLPGSFFLFAFTHQVEDDPWPGIEPGPRPTAIMPLIHIPNWNLGRMSTDSSEGVESVVLPFLPLPAVVTDPLNVTRPLDSPIVER